MVPEEKNGQRLVEGSAMEHGQVSAAEVGLQFWVKKEASRRRSAPIRLGRTNTQYPSMNPKRGVRSRGEVCGDPLSWV